MWKLSMFELQELVRLRRMGTPVREIARMLGISPNTERPYREALQEVGLLEGPVDVLPSEEALAEAVAKVRGSGVRREQVSSVAPWMGSIESWWKQGGSPKAIYDRLKREEAEFSGSLSAVKRACLRLSRARGVREEDVAIPVETAPGDVAQVDFGYVGKRLDPQTMTVRKTWVFVMVLAHSRHQYCEIVFDQKSSTWLGLHVRAFEFFGGVPRTLVPDNLKSAVIRAAFTPDQTVALNRSYRELARYYGCKIDPTPPYAPQKKGKVESQVKYVQRNFFSTYGEDYDTVELQQRLSEWVMTTAGQRIHGTTHRKPLEVFEEVERQALLPLVAKPYQPMLWKTVKVHRDSHIAFQKTLYSVPWRWVGHQGWVRANATRVEIYMGDVRVATHRVGQPGQRVTDENHLPQRRASLRHRSRAHWEAQAEYIGPETKAYICDIFDSDDVLSQLRIVQAVVNYLGQFPQHRAEAASARARFYGNYSYRGVKRILTEALDRQPLPTVVNTQSAPLTSPRFTRNIKDMLELHIEENHEPH